jgi:hypothetical protein
VGRAVLHLQRRSRVRTLAEVTSLTIVSCPSCAVTATQHGDREFARARKRSPQANVDMALLKSFRMPWSENQRLEFRAEAFDAFNHPSFNHLSVNPNSTGSLDSANVNIQDPGQYGVLTNPANAARQLQLGLRYDF